MKGYTKYVEYQIEINNCVRNTASHLWEISTFSITYLPCIEHTNIYYGSSHLNSLRNN